MGAGCPSRSRALTCSCSRSGSIPWDIGSLAKFILFIGPCSSVFDYTTFLMILYVFNAWAPTDHVDRHPAPVHADRTVSRSRALPLLYWLFVVVTLLAYMLLAQGVKSWLMRGAWV